jgi:hypothetical protein
MGHKGISWESVQQLLRNIIQGAANRSIDPIGKWHASIAVFGKLRIEWNGPETWNPVGQSPPA